MHIKKWRKLAGEELNSRLKALTGAAIVDAQVNEQGLRSLLLHLRTNDNNGPLEIKLEHGGYGSSMYGMGYGRMGMMGGDPNKPNMVMNTLMTL